MVEPILYNTFRVKFFVKNYHGFNQLKIASKSHQNVKFPVWKY